MRRVLFISWWWPYPADNGSKIRVYNLLRQLAKVDVVCLLSFAEAGEATSAQVEHLGGFLDRIETVPKPHFHPGSLKSTLGYASRWPRAMMDTYSQQMAGLVRQHAPESDVVIASQLQTLRYLEVIGHKPAILEEVEVAAYHNHVQAEQRRLAHLRAQLTLSKVESVLRHEVRHGVALTVVSDEEKHYMERLHAAGMMIRVIPNGVDTVLKQPSANILPQPDSLIYPGSVTYAPNYDAVTYFIDSVLPLVRERHPQVRFTVTGDVGYVNLTPLAAQPGVHFTGLLPEVDPAVQASWATVVPLRQGGGTRLKILESMALGTPVISTHKGAEGLQVTDGENILLADSPAEMAAAVDRLLTDPALRTRLSRAGRTLVEREYDWSIIGDQLTDLVEDLAKRRSMVHA